MYKRLKKRWLIENKSSMPLIVYVIVNKKTLGKLSINCWTIQKLYGPERFILHRLTDHYASANSPRL